MYLGNIEYGVNFITFQGVITAEWPIAHGEPDLEKKEKDNNRPVRKMMLSANGSLFEVPYVSSIHIAHHFRTLMVLDLLKKARLTNNDLLALRNNAPEFYQTLFSGGTLNKVEKEANGEDSNSKKGKKDEKRGTLKEAFPSPESFIEVFYPIRLFGGALFWLNSIVESTIGVGHAWPLTVETAALFGLTASALSNKFGITGNLPQVVDLTKIRPATFVRTDDTASGKREEGEEDARMIYNVYYIPAGTKFIHEVNVEAKDDVELALSAFRYLIEKLLPTNPYLGGLVKRGFGKVKFDYPAVQWNGKEVGTEAYEEHLEKIVPLVREKISAMLKKT